MHKRYAEDLLNLIRNRNSTPSSNLLIVLVKLTNFGLADLTNKEDERAAGLARRAQRGDYDEGMFSQLSRACN